MYKYLVMDSEYCSMGRWISVIVGHAMNMKLYEGKDLIALANESWLTEEYLKEFDHQLGQMTLEEVKQSKEMQKVHAALTRAIKKAVDLGPCIIHERAAGEILKDQKDCLKVFLYNTNLEHRIPRAIGDKTYNLKELSKEQVIEFIKKEDHKRSVYHDAVSTLSWGQKEAYDLCLDSDQLSREKCAEILIESLKEVTLDLEQCSKIISESFN